MRFSNRLKIFQGMSNIPVLKWDNYHVDRRMQCSAIDRHKTVILYWILFTSYCICFGGPFATARRMKLVDEWELLVHHSLTLRSSPLHTGFLHACSFCMYSLEVSRTRSSLIWIPSPAPIKRIFRKGDSMLHDIKRPCGTSTCPALTSKTFGSTI